MPRARRRRDNAHVIAAAGGIPSSCESEMSHDERRHGVTIMGMLACPREMKRYLHGGVWRQALRRRASLRVMTLSRHLSAGIAAIVSVMVMFSAAIFILRLPSWRHSASIGEIHLDNFRSMPYIFIFTSKS